MKKTIFIKEKFSIIYIIIKFKKATSGRSIFTSIFMSKSINLSFCKESNKLAGVSNYLAWKKRTNLNLIGNEVMDHVKGSITNPAKKMLKNLQSS